MGFPSLLSVCLLSGGRTTPQQDVSASHAPCRGRATPRDSERVGLGEAKGAVTE